MTEALEVIGGRTTNPGAAITALTPNTGDSFAIKAFDSPAVASLENLWAEGATAGVVRIRSPRMHDNVQGIRKRFLANTPAPLLGYEVSQPLFEVDSLTFEMSGGAAETDQAFFLVRYTELGGINPRIWRWEEVEPRIVNLLTVEVACVTSATAGDWSPGVAINATFDLLEGGIDYALIGYETDVRVGCVAVRGPDTGNLRAGGPGILTPIETREWFLWNSRMAGKPFIPIINAANKGATSVFVSDPAVSAAVNVILELAQLRPGG